jgi:trimeric autotransporter adhesin
MAITLNGTTGITTPAIDNQGNLTVDGGTIKLDGNYPVGFGNVALGNTALDSNVSGASNVAIGADALTANTASNNTAVGYQAGVANTTGIITSSGYRAGYSNTTGANNSFFGVEAGYANTTSSNSAYFGEYSGRNSTGAQNTFYGQQSGWNVTTGSKNTILGRYNGNQDGLDIRTSSNYIVLSNGDGNPRAYLDNSTAFVLQGTANAANPFITSWDSSVYVYGRRISSSGVYLAHNATSWASTSDENRKDIIEPITDAVNKVLQLRTVIGKYKIDEEGTRRPFLIAQDVQAVLPEAVQSQEDDAGEFLGMSYTDIIPLLTAAIKEQQATITALTARITALEGN